MSYESIENAKENTKTDTQVSVDVVIHNTNATAYTGIPLNSIQFPAENELTHMYHNQTEKILEANFNNINVVNENVSGFDSTTKSIKATIISGNIAYIHIPDKNISTEKNLNTNYKTLQSFYENAAKELMYTDYLEEPKTDSVVVLDNLQQANEKSTNLDSSLSSESGIENSRKEYVSKDLDSLEEERQLALEYIQNEIKTMYGEHEINEGSILKPEETQSQNMLVEGVGVVENSSDLITTELLSCEFCQGMFFSESEINSHKCEKLINETSRESHVNESKVEAIIDDPETGVPVIVVKKHLRQQKNPCRPRRKRQLTIERSQSDKGPYKCHICRRTLSRLAGLTIHMRRHTGEMPYKCDHCSKRFVVLCDLDRHMYLHVGQKKYSFCCDVCQKPFMSTAGMLEHKSRRHRGEPLHTCKICGKGFDRKSKFTNHNNLQHKQVNKNQSENITTQTTKPQSANETVQETAPFEPSIMQHVLTNYNPT